MLKWVGISAIAGAAFVAFMASGSGAAEHGDAAKEGATAPAKQGAAPATTEPAKGATPASAGAAGAAKTDKAEKADKGEGAVKTGSAEKSAEAGAPPTRSKSKRKGAVDAEPQLPPGQGPPPPSPLTVNGLHQEVNRDRSPGGEFDAPPRVKLEQLLTEVGKARQSLHDDTLKLEAIAGNEPSREGDSTGGASAAPAPGAPGQPPQKNPLDVLAKALRGIKPEQAGPIVARLDKALAATVLLKMPPVDAGKIMGALKPEVAAELATQIAMRAPSPQSGGKR